ncbi:MAG: hypothetical protein ACREUY_01200 [Burkholderiales bacterium]
MLQGFKTKIGVALLAISATLQAGGIDLQLPSIDPDMAARATNIGAWLGTALALFGIRDKLNRP